MCAIVLGSALFSCLWADPQIHPGFSITKKELLKTTATLPTAVRKNILESPKEFLGSIRGLLASDSDLFVLVDKSHPLAESFVPSGLVNVADQRIPAEKPDAVLHRILIPDLRAMTKEASANGVKLSVASAYRSYANQEATYAYWVKTLGQKQADRESAKPGFSQHQLGTTIDFYPIDDSFKNTPADLWLMKNASRFGFSMSYPDGYESLTGYKYEPWHYRYVGKICCALIDRYFSGIQATFLVYYDQYKELFRKKMK